MPSSKPLTTSSRSVEPTEITVGRSSCETTKLGRGGAEVEAEADRSDFDALSPLPAEGDDVKGIDGGSSGSSEMQGTPSTSYCTVIVFAFGAADCGVCCGVRSTISPLQMLRPASIQRGSTTVPTYPHVGEMSSRPEIGIGKHEPLRTRVEGSDVVGDGPASRVLRRG